MCPLLSNYGLLFMHFAHKHKPWIVNFKHLYVSYLMPCYISHPLIQKNVYCADLKDEEKEMLINAALEVGRRTPSREIVNCQSVSCGIVRQFDLRIEAVPCAFRLPTRTRTRMKMKRTVM